MGPKDRKRIAGIVLDTTSGEHKLSIGSDKKLSLRQEFQGRSWASLNDSERGTICWVKTINPDQYSFICQGMYSMPSESELASEIEDDESPLGDDAPIGDEELMPF